MLQSFCARLRRCDERGGGVAEGLDVENERVSRVGPRQEELVGFEADDDEAPPRSHGVREAVEEGVGSVAPIPFRGAEDVVGDDDVEGLASKERGVAPVAELARRLTANWRTGLRGSSNRVLAADVFSYHFLLRIDHLAALFGPGQLAPFWAV